MGGIFVPPLFDVGCVEIGNQEQDGHPTQIYISYLWPTKRNTHTLIALRAMDQNVCASSNGSQSVGAERQKRNKDCRDPESGDIRTVFGTVPLPVIGGSKSVKCVGHLHLKGSAANAKRKDPIWQWPVRVITTS